MNRFAPLAALALLCSSTLGFAEPPKVDHVVALMEQAKTSPAPLPLLEQAKAELKKFEPPKVHYRTESKAPW